MLKPGMMIGDRYEVIEVVGAGGMSVVYKAKCHKLNRFVAIKVLKPEFGDDSNFISKFRIEAQSAAGLSHPNIVNVYDVGEDEGIYYIVMELVEGITLKEYIQDKGRIELNQAIDFSLQIASAIDTAHESHIVHRDIKPQNIIVSKNGNLKVTDFGIAKAATSNTIASTAMGSVHYISPEQARGGYSDEKSDIYSLGITMYEMVTGRVPFEGENNVTVALMHIQGEMIPPRAYYPDDISAGFEKIILKATQKKPERRYLTAKAMIGDLKKIQVDPSYENVGKLNQGAAAIDGSTKMMTQDEVGKIKSQIQRTEPQPRVTVFPIETKEEKVEAGNYTERSNESRVQPSVNPNQKGYSSTPKEIEEEEEEEDEVDPKLMKLTVVFGVVVGVLAIILVALLIGSSGIFSGKKTTATTTTEAAKKVSVPKFEGLTVEEAEDLAKEKDIKISITYVESDTEEGDIILSQSVEVGEEIDAEEEVELTASATKKLVKVSSVIGLTESQAKAKLEDEGFEVKREYLNDDEAEIDTVFKQSPEEGTEVQEGETITIYVCIGKDIEEVEVKSLKGMTVEEATEQLKTDGLEIGEITEEYSDVEAGKIISQSYTQGQKVPEGTKIDVCISKGPEEKIITYNVSFSGTLKLVESELAETVTAVNVNIIYRQTSGNTTVDHKIYSNTNVSAQGFSVDMSTVESLTGLQDAGGELVIVITDVDSGEAVAFDKSGIVKNTETVQQ
ncbi:MAG: Stk1 family PASTA domain-containing Ser/Thr kinase [Lachnospiraceae bacterium]|nr:Stk1 family PASTA domain-containing Ser/Thr kinase [Lachnospiraceae bacterium]